MKATREELAHAVDEAPWSALRAHLERDGLIVVAGLELVDAAVKIVEDDAAAIARWVSGGELGKPTAEQVATWDVQRDKPFYCLIVSPYVLIREKPETLQ